MSEHQVATYQALTPDLLAALIHEAEARARELQSRLSAMRRAQKRQRMGKVPQHTRPLDGVTKP